jgi:hypothetical protein
LVSCVDVLYDVRYEFFWGKDRDVECCGGSIYMVALVLNTTLSLLLGVPLGLVDH